MSVATLASLVGELVSAGSVLITPSRRALLNCLAPSDKLLRVPKLPCGYGAALGEYSLGCVIPHGDRYVIDGVDPIQPNTKVAVEVNPNRFLELFLSRVKGK